jgi:NTP pyrophosphatase (non-canonical NTP hydrolase)
MSGLTFDGFAERAVPRKGSGPLLLWAAGLGGETGEVAEAVALMVSYAVHAGRVVDLAKKASREEAHRDPLEATREALRREAGDALFYLHHTLVRCGLTLEDAALALLAKLEDAR